MTLFLKRGAAAVLIAIMAFALCACASRKLEGDGAPTPRPLPANTMRILLTVDANGAGGMGMLMNGASITTPKGGVFSDVFRLLELYGIPVETEAVNGVNRITSVSGVKNGADGIYSYWMITVNGVLVNEGVDTLTLQPDDNVRLFFTRNNGADAGV